MRAAVSHETGALFRVSRGGSQRPSPLGAKDGSVATRGPAAGANSASKLFDSCRSTRAAAAPPPLPSALKRSANADLAALVRQRKRKCVEMRRTGVFAHDSDDSLIIAAAADIPET